jgi:hypothetical protein
MPQKTVYLDVCALSRPFDDQGYLRIKLETDAINMILFKVKQGKYKLLFSPVHIKEIEAYDDILERVELQTILKKFGEQIFVNLSITRTRAEQLVNLGFGVADAAHVAFAEETGCGNPVAFCEKEKLR